MSDIRAGLVSNIKDDFDVNMSGYLEPPKSPWFEIDFPPDATTTATYGRGTFELQLIVRGIAGLGDVVETQKQLDLWMEPGAGVWEAIESDRTLGNKIDDLRVKSATWFRRVQVPETPNASYLCHEWLVDLVVSP